jgi:tetratricopeptide (TPR) repeat protein
MKRLSKLLFLAVALLLSWTMINAQTYTVSPSGWTSKPSQDFNKEAYEYARKGDFYNAKKAIDKAHSLCPNNADYYDSEGEICLMQGRTERALSLWNKVIELVPDYLKKHNGSTPFYLQLKEQGLLGQ